MKARFFKLAREVRTKSDHHQHHVGCVLVRKNVVVSTGYNSLKTHTKSPDEYKTLHAETAALLKASPELLQGSVAYIYRECRDGRLGNSRPCPSCYSALKTAGIKEIYFSHETGFKKELL